MADIKKPSTPLEQNGVSFYPLTSASQVLVNGDSGERLDDELELITSDITGALGEIDIITNTLNSIDEDISSIDQDITTIKTQVGNVTTQANQLEQQKANKATYFYVNLLASGWSDTAPYKQRVQVNGLLSTDIPFIDCRASGGTSDAIKMKEAWGYVDYISTDNGYIEAECWQNVPTVNIGVRLTVYR